jgi:hypothetical protein
MNEFEFALNFKLSDPGQDPPEYLDALFEAGCDDATIGLGIDGNISLQFTRNSPSVLLAVESAFRDIRKVLPDAEFISASPDLVNLTDVANHFHVSRQYARKLMSRKGVTPPTPIYSFGISMWHLLDIIKYFESNKIAFKKKARSESLKAVSTAAMQLNIRKAQQGIPCEYEQTLNSLVL